MATFRYLINGGSKQTGSSVIFVKFNKRGEGGGKGVKIKGGGGVGISKHLLIWGMNEKSKFTNKR